MDGAIALLVLLIEPLELVWVTDLAIEELVLVAAEEEAANIEAGTGVRMN